MGIEISVNKKGLMKAGIISSIIFALVFIGFLVVNFILPTYATEYNDNMGLSVVLNSPGNFTYVNNASFVSGAPFRNVNFTFTPTWNSTTEPVNATLYTNASADGSWNANGTNATVLRNNTINGINLTLPADGSYKWNVVLFNTTTGRNDTNLVNWTVIVDTVNPIFNTTTPADNSYISGNDSQLFQVYAYDLNLNTSNVTLHYKVHDAGGSPATWTTGVGLTCYAQTSPLYICNTTVNDLYDVNGEDSFSFYFKGTDNVTNYQSSGTASSPLTTTIDRAAPANTSTSITKVASGTKYDTTGLVNYGFQMDWTDSVSGMGAVKFESNFTGSGSTFANTTASNSSSAYYVNFTITNFNQSGTYAYKWYANDSITPTANTNFAVSDTFYYTIATADNPVDLYINNTKNANVLDLVYPNTVNATGVVTAGEMVLYRNRSGTWTDVSATENRTSVILPVGTHAYTVNVSATANYSANNSAPSYYVIVSQGATTVNLYLNDTQANKTIASGGEVNITLVASNSEGVAWIFNGTGIANQTSGNRAMNITTWTGTPGTQWNITGYYNGSQNYTASSPISYYIKIESTPPTYADNYTNATASIWGKYQGTITVNAAWNDNFNLSRVWLYSNESGWANTYSSFGTNNVSNFTINPSVVDITNGNVTIQARIYANDTSNNTNNTNTFSWIIDGTPPVLSSPYPSNNTFIYLNSSYPFRISVIDSNLNVTNATVYWKRSTAGGWSSGSMTCTGNAPSFTCLKSNVDLSGYPEGAIIYYYFEASDNSSLMRNSSSSTNPYVVTLDISAPKYSNNGTNATVIGRYDGIKIYANWSDADTLDSYILQLGDGTDTWNSTQYSGTFGSGTWSNISLSNSTWTPGTTITWKIYVNDSVPNWNVTTPVTFSIDNTIPIPLTIYTNTTNATIIAKGTQINLLANWSDNIGLITRGQWWVWYNESNAAGVNRSYTAFTANNQTNSSFTINTSNFTNGVGFTAKFYANDTSGNENNTQTWQWTIDGTKPNWVNNITNVTNATTIAKGTVINLTANWNDNIELSKYWLESNETGGWTNGSLSSFTTGNMSDSLINTAGSNFDNGETIWARVYANDTSGNDNITGTFYWTIDGTAPTYALVTSSNSSLSNITETISYAPAQSYYFNISLSDNINVSAVVFEWNGGNASTSPTEVSRNSTGGNFSFTKSDLGVGNYIFKWYINDTSNNWIASTTSVFNITQNVSTASFVGLALNGTEGNATYTYPSRTNATAWRNITEAGNLSLWRNGAIVQSTLTATSVAEEIILGNGSYNYTLTFTPTNYTSASISVNRYLLVVKGTTNMTLWIGQLGSVVEGNVTLPQGSTLNITATINTSYNVWLNITTSLNISTGWFNLSTQNTRITNTTSTSIFTVNNDYNITAHFDGDANFTESSRTYWLNVTSDLTAPTVKLWDDTSANYWFNNTTAVKSGASININASISDAGVGMGTGYICNVTLVLSGTNYNVGTISYSGATSSGWCNKTVTVPASLTSGAYTLNVSINDTNNNWGGNNSFVLTVDNTAPVLSISTPSNATYKKSVADGDGKMSIWINGTVSDNLQMGVANVSINGTYFNASTTSAAPWNFSGVNNNGFQFRNTSAIPDGLHAFRINYTDNATNVGNVTVYFYIDNTAPSTVKGLTNSSSQTYAASASQTIEVLIIDGVQTNQTITLNYYINGSWYTALLTGTPGATTIYSGSISTLGDDYKVDSSSRSYVPYYVSGVDNATNTITGNNGSTSTPLANLTLGTTGTIQGYVYLTNTSIAPNASVQVSDGTRTVNTNTAGLYQITGVPAGTYTLTVSGNGYRTNSTSVSVTVGSTATQNMRITGAENFNITLPGTSGTSTTGFWDTGWHDFKFRTGLFSAATTNYTVENLFLSVGTGTSYNYTAVWRYNATSQGWASFIPKVSGNSLINISSSDDSYWVYMNTTDRVETEARYT